MLRKWLLSKALYHLNRLPKDHPIYLGFKLACIVTIIAFFIISFSSSAPNSYVVSVDLTPLKIQSNNHSPQLELPSNSRQNWIEVYDSRIPGWDKISIKQKEQLLQESMKLGEP